ncbi:MAG TPA: DUF1015 domain-containing protein [Acidimicrobiia bacterium]|nr:DUF1015 domain-containing protein [Acidimicrobiia bacterium]
MPDFLPFRGTRYRDLPDSSRVVAPPYDVIDEEDRSRLEATDPHNAVRLILPRVDPPADPYDHAASLLQSWIEAGVLTADPGPAFYEYRMRFTDAAGHARQTSGVIGALVLPDGDGDVFGHERTLPKARSDRLALLRATRANLDPIWGLSLTDDLNSALDPDRAPTTTATDATGTRHELTLITDPDTQRRVRVAVASTPVVLADGHHRFETACAYRAEHPDDPDARAIMAFVVGLDDELLDVRAIHRVVQQAPRDLHARVDGLVTSEDLGPNTPDGVRDLTVQMTARRGLGLVSRDGLTLMVPTLAGLERINRELPEELREVDSARFDTLVRPALDDAELSYRDDALTVASMVEKGAADLAVLLRPVTVAQIRAAAFARLRMPEKTSYFAPKPRTGMVFRRLDD